MYIWIILSMFITALYAFNLHVRQDSRALYVEPQAQMLISKLALQHDAAREFFHYMNNQVSSETNNEGFVCETDGDGNCKTDEDGNIIYASKKDFYAEAEDPFSNPIAKKLGEDYRRFSDVPIDYHLEDNMKNDFVAKFFKLSVKELAKGAHSRMFCVDPDDITSTSPYESEYFGSCSNGRGMNCCYSQNDGGGSLYAVTWAPIPVRWLQRDKDGSPTGFPNRDMVSVFRHFGVTNTEFGYFADYDSLDVNGHWGSSSSSSGRGSFLGSCVIDEETGKCARDGKGNIIYENSEGDIRDIQTNTFTDYSVKDFQYFVKGYKDAPVGLPTVIAEALKEDCGYKNGKPTGSKPTCLVAISQIK